MIWMEMKLENNGGIQWGMKIIGDGSAFLNWEIILLFFNIIFIKAFRNHKTLKL